MIRTVLSSAVLALAAASNTDIAGYSPGSDVTDHNALDKDVQAMDSAIKNSAGTVTTTTLQAAQEIYNDGGYSRAEGQFQVPALANGLSKGSAYTVTQAGNSNEGYIYKAANAGDTMIRVRYTTVCQDGGLPTASKSLTGCFSNTGALTIKTSATASTTVTITPTAVVNKYRTVSGFSDGGDAKMVKEPYFVQYKAYYGGNGKYGDDFCTAAADGTGVWATVDLKGKKEGLMKGAVYQNVWMYTIHEMEDAIEDCTAGCINCNDDPVHAWDEAVAFYTGTVEGTTAASAATTSGYMLHNLADKRCKNFGTCTGANGLTGGSKVNRDIFELFDIGLALLTAGKCPLVVPVKNAIVQKMAIPLIQGTLRYSHKLNLAANAPGDDKSLAEGYAFASAVAPLVSTCRRADADKILDSLDITKNTAAGTMSQLQGKFAGVKAAFEDNYECLNITCSDVGSLHDSSDNIYADAKACTFQLAREKGGTADITVTTTVNTETETTVEKKLGGFSQAAMIAVGVSGGVAAVASVGFIYLLCSKKSAAGGGPVEVELQA